MCAILQFVSAQLSISLTSQAPDSKLAEQFFHTCTPTYMVNHFHVLKLVQNFV